MRKRKLQRNLSIGKISDGFLNKSAEKYLLLSRSEKQQVGTFEEYLAALHKEGHNSRR